MKIAIDCRMLEMSGIGVYLKNIVNYWLSDYPQFNYLLIGNSKKIKKHIVGPYSIIETDISIFTINELFRFPVNQINTCDLFYSPNFNIPHGIKIPIYCTIHDVVFLDIPTLSSWFGRLIRKMLLKRAIRLSDKIFTVSNFSKERILVHFHTQKEIIVAHNAITQSLLSYTFKKKRKNEKYFIYVGNVKPHKGLDILLDAYKILQENGLKHKLLIVGKYDNFVTGMPDGYQKYFNSNEGVEFTGFVGDEELYDLIYNADILIQPSYYEGFGIPPLEAIYAHTPVVLSNISVFKELYSDFDVQFFESGDVNDLAIKIMKTINKGTISNQKMNAMVKFNYSKTASIIMNNIEKQ